MFEPERCGFRRPAMTSRRGQRAGRRNAGENPRAERKPQADAERARSSQRRGRGYSSKRAHEAEQQNRHGGGEGRILRIHEHVAVVKRAGRKQHERDQPGDRPAKTAADAPGRDQADDADGRADKPPRFEQPERQHFGDERRSHVEAAAVFVEIDEGKRALSEKPEP